MCDICWKKYCVDGDKYLLINMALNTWKQWSLCLVAILCVWLDGQNWRTYFTTTSINIYIPQLMFRCFFNRMMHHGTFFSRYFKHISTIPQQSWDSQFMGHFQGHHQIQWLNLLVWVPSSAKGPRSLHPQLCCWHPYDKWFLYSVLLPSQYPFQMDRVPNSWYLHIYQWLPYYTRADNFISSWFLLPPPMFGIAG